MDLYIKQKVFTLKDKFNVCDINGEQVYYVEGHVFSVGRKLHIMTPAGEEVAMIHQKVLSLMPRFFLEMNGEQVMEIRQKFSFVKPKFTVSPMNWMVEGSVLEHNYSIMDGSNIIAVISQKWLSWGDTYEIHVADDANTIYALGIVLAIDSVKAENAAIAVSTTTSN